MFANSFTQPLKGLGNLIPTEKEVAEAGGDRAVFGELQPTKAWTALTEAKVL